MTSGFAQQNRLAGQGSAGHGSASKGSASQGAFTGDPPSPLHVLFAPDRPTPRIVGRDLSGDLRSLDLAGTFAWRVSQVRRCVGKFDGERHHVPCPTTEPVGMHRQCAPCSGLEDQECVFEPRCQANPASCACLTTFRDVPHLVYIAFHGTLAKVGMTQERRVENRLREQGADGWLAVARLASRGEARMEERKVSVLFGIPEHRSHRETLPQLARAVPWDAIESRAAQLRLRLEGAYDVERVLHRITDHPITQPLRWAPRRIAGAGVHRGTWIGGKGNHLVYQEVPRPDRLDLAMTRPLVALKRSDLVGRTIEVLPA